MMSETCVCQAYKFPHRRGGGACNVQNDDTRICSDCGEVCIATKTDFGIGTTEAWGVVSTHHDWQIASDCCHADIECLDNNWGRD